MLDILRQSGIELNHKANDARRTVEGLYRPCGFFRECEMWNLKYCG